MFLDIPLFNGANHATAFYALVSFAALLVGAGIIGFVLGIKRFKTKSIVASTVVLAALGYVLIGMWGTFVAGLAPMMYRYGKS